MINYFLPIAALSVILLAGCITHVGKSNEDPPRRKTTGRYNVKHNIVYSKPAGRTLMADTYVPEGKGPFPAILVVHGGGWTAGRREQMNSISRKLARRGYVAFNISYRFAPEHIYPAQLDDMTAAVKFMRLNAKDYNIDPKKIGAFGYSAGAHLVALLATTQSDENSDSRLQAVVAGGIPSDLTTSPRNEMVLAFMGKTIEEDPHRFIQASPLSQISEKSPPMFLYHGGFDRIVSPTNTQKMKAALDTAGVHAETYVMQGMGHIPVFLFDNSAVKAAIRFFDEQL